MRKIAFETDAFKQLEDWAKTDKKIFFKIFALIKDIQKNPFSGMGKPEHLNQSSVNSQQSSVNINRTAQ